MIYSKLDVYGLIKAIDNFDITQEVQFSTYRGSDDNWRNKKIFKR